MEQQRIMVVCGTRPDAIKLAPVFAELKQRCGDAVFLVTSGQHRELARQVFNDLQLTPDVDLDVMRPGQPLPELTAAILSGMSATIDRLRPSVALVHGDTATAHATALACFYRGVPVAHVEAGLRSFDLDSPFPEELHRRVIATIATLHFAPTALERDNLVREGVALERIHVTGNTIIDAVSLALSAIQDIEPTSARRTLVLTLHRRERGDMRALLASLRAYLDRHPEIELVCPMHLQPSVRHELTTAFANHPRVTLSPPLPHGDFLRLIGSASIVLTDSGGVQEEAAFLRKPVIVLRARTERHDGVAEGLTRLACENIAPLLDELLTTPPAPPPRRFIAESPSRRIANVILEGRAA